MKLLHDLSSDALTGARAAQRHTAQLTEKGATQRGGTGIA